MVSVHFYKANTFLGKVVQFFLKGEFVHCAIQVDGKHVIETDAFKRPTMEHIYQIPNQTIWLDVKEKDVLSRFNEIMTHPYDYGGALSLVGLGSQDPQKVFCVELCYYLLFGEFGYMTPDDFFIFLKDKKTK